MRGTRCTMRGELNARVCNRCGCEKSRVVNCRDYSGRMRRVRECTQCGRRWTTVEVDEWYFDMMDETLRRHMNELQTE